MPREQKVRKSKIVPKEYHDAADLGIINTVNYLGLQLSENRVEQVNDWGISKRTKLAYQKHFRGLSECLTLIGDYESLLLLHKHCPTPFCPSINATSVAHYINSKRGMKGSILKDINQNEVIDVCGKPVQCCGGWNDPKNVKQFMSVHTLRGNGGQYAEPSIDCWNEDFANRGFGCIIHRGKPCIWRNGCPSTHIIVKSAMGKSAKEGEYYVAEGDSALTQFELQRIRIALLAKNNIEDCQLWVLVLISIKLFLRSNEATGDCKNDHSIRIPSGLTIESFDRSLSIIRDGIIQSLAVKINEAGINEAKIQVKLNEVLAHLQEVKGIIIIETKEEKFMKNEYENNLLEGSRREVSMETVEDKRSNKIGATFDKIMQFARHKDIAVAKSYKNDASYLLEVAKQMEMPVEGCVSKWKPAFVQNLQLGRVLCEKDVMILIYFQLEQLFLSNIAE
ncbi:hypothetical protein O9G_004101 [Rozella allomycis CSF55]|uniref:Uncharacterized protein n=1 Tax=Rozella allomycis (strain CSF55) TaxID=988480 RepID=A0A075ARM5_ROZAC|nr:hypothetical protein O9G_004101 [Rozella allomycis CSF55]|eukprot:EPZ32830.1 hypothetical protein O9G_004101 [Rozella allomycis CSF55]